MSSTLNKTRGFLEGVSVKPPQKKNCLEEMCWIVLEMTGICVFWLLDWSCVMLLQVDLLYILYQIYIMSVLFAHFTSYLHEIIQSLWRWRSPEVTYDLDHLAAWQVMKFFCITFLSWRLITKPPHPPEMIAIHLIVILNGLCSFRPNYQKP